MLSPTVGVLLKRHVRELSGVPGALPSTSAMPATSAASGP